MMGTAQRGAPDPTIYICTYDGARSEVLVGTDEDDAGTTPCASFLCRRRRCVCVCVSLVGGRNRHRNRRSMTVALCEGILVAITRTIEALVRDALGSVGGIPRACSAFGRGWDCGSGFDKFVADADMVKLCCFALC